MSTVQELDRLLESFVRGGLPGCGLQVRQWGKVLYEGYFGEADRETGRKIDSRSVFRQASLSKIPLYTTLMILFERGKFLLTDPIGWYLPEWSTSQKFVFHANGSVSIENTEHPVTVRDVLSMKCGLPY